MVSPTDLTVPNVITFCTYNSGFNQAIVLVLLILAFITGIVYMLAQFMRRPEWEAWVKIQLYNIMISALLAGAAIWFAGFACGISVWVGGGLEDPFTIADDYLNDLFSNNIKAAISQLVIVQISSEYAASIYLQIGSPSFGMGLAPFPVYKAISNNAQLLMNIAMPFASSLLAQKIGLEIIHASAFTVLLPVGIFLRAFAVTRDAGAFVIAMSIGLFVVLPLTYVMDKMIVEGPAGTLPPAGQPTICVGMSRGYDRALDYEWWKQVYSPTSGYPSLLNFFSRISIGNYGVSPDTLIAPAMQCLGYVIPQAVFLPAMNLIITIAFINALTKVISRGFGG